MKQSIRQWPAGEARLLVKGVILIICLMFSSKSEAFDVSEQVLLGAIISAQTLDVLQTHKMTTGHFEANGKTNFKEEDWFTKRITGDRAAWYETTAIKAAVLIPTIYMIQKIQNSRLRKLALATVLAISSAPVVHNAREADSSLFMRVQFTIPFTLKGF